MGVAFSKICITPEVAEDGSEIRNPVQVNAVDVSVLRLKSSRARLVAQISRIQLDIDRAHASAIEHKLSSTVAKRYLCAKLMHEAFKEKLEKMITNLDAALIQIDGAQVTNDVVVALREGNEALKLVTDECSDVDEIMGDLQRITRWFSILGQSVPVTTADVSSEYDALVAADALPSIRIATDAVSSTSGTHDGVLDSILPSVPVPAQETLTLFSKRERLKTT